jgi:hypothetical protein
MQKNSIKYRPCRYALKTESTTRIHGIRMVQNQVYGSLYQIAGYDERTNQLFDVQSFGSAECRSYL